MEDILSRGGVNLNRSTLYDWMAAVADVTKPLYELMTQLVLQSKIIQIDDTSVKLIDPLAEGGSRTARFWAYLGDNDHPFEVYGFTVSRERHGPQEFPRDYVAYLQADAYGGYDGVYLKGDGAIKEGACWAHARRYWHKACEEDPARAHYVLAIVAKLYKVEDAAKEKSAAVPRALTIISGNRPHAEIENSNPRYAAVDGLLSDLESAPPASLVPLISDNWGHHFKYRGHGEMPTAERQKLAAIVMKCHQQGLRLRFWAFPENSTLWTELKNAGVDLIGTDDLHALQQHLRR